MARALEADYLVVGAGASGMAFADALTGHADVQVALVDRRHAPGGHWLDAYPFVRLHQASSFYGVASTSWDRDRSSRGARGGAARASGAAQVCAYYERVLNEQLVPSGLVRFHPSCEYLGDGGFVSRVSGQRYQARPGCRIVDARYLAPEIPATTAPPFGVADGVRAMPVNELARLESAPREFVIVGSGKTATDACVWLLKSGVDPDSICWVRPRDPWMFDRAVLQPDPATFIGMAADVMEAASAASGPDDLFLRMEDAGVMLRIDTSVTPTMAKTPTLARWELSCCAASSGWSGSAMYAGSSPDGCSWRGARPGSTGTHGRPLRRVRPAVPAADPDLGRRRDHDSAGARRLSVPRRGPDRVRGGDP